MPSPSDRDATIKPGWRKCLHLPQFVACLRCGCLSDQLGMDKHDEVCEVTE